MGVSSHGLDLPVLEAEVDPGQSWPAFFGGYGENSLGDQFPQGLRRQAEGSSGNFRQARVGTGVQAVDYVVRLVRGDLDLVAFLDFKSEFPAWQFADDFAEQVGGHDNGAS